MKFKEFIDREEIALILEGVNDPSIFKAIFLAGGPGSGKSFVSSKTTGGQGFKVVNSDVLFEILSKKNNIDLKDMVSADIDKISAVRGKAKSLSNKQMEGYLNGRLGVVIDGTGKDFDKIKKQRSMLELLGYDTYMIFVNTSLEVALERNNKRSRVVPEKLVKDSWNGVQNNIGKFQSLFGATNMKIVDNNVYSTDDKIFNSVWKDVMKFTKSPVDNFIAKKWIKSEKEKRKK